MSPVYSFRSPSCRISTLSAALFAVLVMGVGNDARADASATDVPHDNALALAAGNDASPLLMLGSADFSAEMFAGGGMAAPGSYDLDVYFNSQWIERRVLELRTDADGEIQPCIDRKVLSAWGVDLGKVDSALAAGSLDAAAIPDEGSFCVDLEDYIPHASVISDTAQLRLDVTVPHVYVSRMARDWVDPAEWQDGITAGLLRYNVNAYRDERPGYASQSGSATFNAGLNVGAWRLRHDGSARWSDVRGLEYTSGSTYLQRSIRSLGAQLQLGEVYSRGDLFSSMPFTGAQMYSDESMLPISQRGYAPTIRGVANGNSRVSIYQQGRLIHEVSVANGPFAIDDLYATAYGGDLEVVVTAANGAEQRFTQTYAAVPQLLRPGQNRFSAVAGQVRSWDGAHEPYLVEGTWRRGISNALTGYGGLRLSDGYQAFVLGAAINLPIGALATDVTVSRSEQPNGQLLRGQSYRITYSKELFARRTNLSLAAYRYSTEHFRDLSDHIRANSPTDGVIVAPTNYRQRSRFDINVSQRLPDGWGNLWLSANTTSYWDRPQSQTAYSVGYNNTLGNLTLGFNAQRSRTSYGGRAHDDTQIGLSLSMPLGVVKTSSPPRLNVDANHGGGDTSYRAGISGNVGENLYYGASASQSSNGDLGLALNGNYHGRYAELSGYYSRTGSSQSLSLGASGGMVVHRGGLTLASSLGDTVGLVSAEGAAGARVNQDSVRIDRRGYAVVGHISPYRVNQFSLDPADAGDEVSILSGSNAVAPTLGAVVPIQFRTERAAATRLLVGVDDAGQPLPFGSPVTDPQGRSVGMVGQAGQMWLTFAHKETRTINIDTAKGRLRCEISNESEVTTCQPNANIPSTH